MPKGPKRTRGTVCASLDGGKTRPHAKTLIEGEFAYSSLVWLADGRICMICEAAGHLDIRLVRFHLAQIGIGR